MLAFNEYAILKKQIPEHTPKNPVFLGVNPEIVF